MLHKKKIVWLSFHPNIYNNFLFSTINADLAFELEACFVQEVLDSHPWKEQNTLNFRHQKINAQWWADWALLWRAIMRKGGEYFVVGGWNNPTMFLIITISALLNKPFAVWTDTPNVLEKRSFWKKKLRQWWLDFVFSPGKKSKLLATGQIGVKNAQLTGIPAHKIFDFPFATDLDFFRPLPKTSVPHKLTLVSSGRLKNDHKGYHIAIQSLGILKEKGIINFTYKIAGTGPDRSAILNQIEALALTEHVELLGWMELDQLPSLYQSADVLLHPSFFDPFPNAVLEAMACGLPVIGSHLAGSAVDRITDGENGFLHQAGDAQDLASKIELLFIFPETLRPMGLAARKTAEAHQVQKNVEVLKVMLESHYHPCAD